MPEEGPTVFLLQRKAEQIGLGVTYDATKGRAEIEGGKLAHARVEFATSSKLALLYEHGKILSKHYRAGTEYAWLHRLLWGRSTPKPSSLGRIMYSDLAERIDVAKKASRNENLDDEAYIEWMQEQRTLYERGEYRLRHIAGETHVTRRLIRITLRAVVIDDLYPSHAGQVGRLRIGLNALAEVWSIE